MPRINRPGFQIPTSLRNWSSWPSPDVSDWNDRDRARFNRLKEAICQRVEGIPYSDIYERTKVSKCEVRRQLRRCLTQSASGQIFGFFALARHARVREYTRSKPVVHTPFSGSAGCAGAMRQFLDRHPDVRLFIDKALFPPEDGRAHEMCISFTHLHAQFIQLVEGSCMLTKADWPLSTDDRGRKSLRAYCKSLMKKNPERWIRARYGKDVVWTTKIGRGIPSLLEPVQPLTTMQLDYLMENAAGTIRVKDPYGIDHAISVRRWYYGLIADVSTSAVFGNYIALEVNPSADCALETLASVFEAEDFADNCEIKKLLPGGKMLMASLVPELRHVGFAMLEVDNGLCNAADDVIHNIIDTVGCTVVFCTFRAWFQHPVIERVNRAIEDEGLKRLISTYGSSPRDPRRDDPTGKAENYDIHLDWLNAVVYRSVHDHNALVRSETNFRNTRVDVFRHLLAHPENGFLPARFPEEKARHLRLLWHMEERFVRGSVEKGVRPHVTVDHWKYTNPLLSSRFDLIGRKVRIWISRRDARVAVATVIDTAEDLGELQCEPRWRRYKLTWQVRKAIKLWLKTGPEHEQVQDPVRIVHDELNAGLVRASLKDHKKVSKKNALIAERLERARVAEEPALSDSPVQADFVRGNAFGLLNNRKA